MSVAYTVTETSGFVTPNVWTKLYDYPSGSTSTYSISSLIITNVLFSGTPNTVDVAVGVIPVTPSDKDIIEYGVVLNTPDGSLEHGNLIMKPGESIWVRATAATIHIRLHGIIFTTALNGVIAINGIYNSGSFQTVHNVPAGNVSFGTYNVILTNVDLVTPAQVTLALAGPRIENATTIGPKDGIERTCLVMTPGESIVIDTNNTNDLAYRITAITKFV